MLPGHDGPSRVGIRLIAAFSAVIGLAPAERAAIAQDGASVAMNTLWRKVNDGNSVDAGEPVDLDFTTVTPFVRGLVTGNGDLVYLFNSRVGTAMGRFSREKRWELWSADGWSSGSKTTAVAVEHVRR